MEHKVTDKMVSFRPDAGLMYLIQQVTKQPTDEILGFFYDFGKEVLIQGIDNMKSNQRSIRKDIRDFYPGTAIPFKMLVEASTWNKNLSNCIIYVMFPDNPIYLKTEEMIELIMEKQLLGASALPDFEEPRSRTPKMYKKLIEQVLRKHNGKTILDSGHPRTPGPSEEALDGTGDST